MTVCYVCIITGLEYKFMVKSVDPDGTTAVTESQNEPDDVVISLHHDLHKEGMEEEGEEYGDKLGEITSPAPVIRPNRTGKNNYFNVTH